MVVVLEIVMGQRSHPQPQSPLWHMAPIKGELGAVPPGRAAAVLLPCLIQHTPSQPTPSRIALTHAWAQPGLLYPQTLFMWHIYSKDWNN